MAFRLIVVASVAGDKWRQELPTTYLNSCALQVLPLFVLAHAVEWVLSAIIGGTFPGAWVLLAPVLEAALWPLISWLLLAPQRRAPDPDENRPL